MTACPECNAEIDDESLSCPQCHRLTHSAELADLSRQAKAAWRVGKFAEERELWERSQRLLPADTLQHTTIQKRVAELDQQHTVAADAQQDWKKGAAGIGPALVVLLAKGKALLLGFAKIGTLLTMVASAGVYWQLYGWGLAIGLVLSIYVHEMGHVIVIRQYGFPASAPMFIPGLGAFIRMRGVKLPPIPDARIGLAGPIYGLGAAIVAFAIYKLTGSSIWGAIAHLAAIINLFNLIPIWQLDGSRGVRSMTRAQRGILVSAVAVLWMVMKVEMFGLILLVAAYRLFTRDWQREPDNTGLFQFVGLLAALGAIVAATPVK